jgi:hypothetical protein
LVCFEAKRGNDSEFTSGFFWHWRCVYFDSVEVGIKQIELWEAGEAFTQNN